MMKRSAIILLFALALLLAPGLAAAAETTAAAPDLSFLSCPAQGEGAAAAPALSVVDAEGTLALAPDCCRKAARQCAKNCRETGVFEFSCDPATCQSSCICNIGP